MWVDPMSARHGTRRDVQPRRSLHSRDHRFAGRSRKSQLAWQSSYGCTVRCPSVGNAKSIRPTTTNEIVVNADIRTADKYSIIFCVCLLSARTLTSDKINYSLGRQAHSDFSPTQLATRPSLVLDPSLPLRVDQQSIGFVCFVLLLSLHHVASQPTFWCHSV